jgi:hypothetical protein
MKAIHLRAASALVLALLTLGSLAACSSDNPNIHTPGQNEYNNRSGGA